MKIGRATWWALMALAVIAVPTLAAACPTCADAIEGGRTSEGFYRSTLFLMAMPFTVAGIAGGTIGFMQWRAARAQGRPWPAGNAEKE